MAPAATADHTLHPPWSLTEVEASTRNERIKPWRGSPHGMVAVSVLLVASLSSAGCLHTWTQTYHDYPPEAWDPPYTQHQANPRDG